MSTTQFAPQLRPLSVGEVLDASFKVVRQSFGTLALCVLVVALPLNILDTLIRASTSDNAFNLDVATNDVSTGTAAAGQLLVGAPQPRADHDRGGRVLPRGVVAPTWARSRRWASRCRSRRAGWCR